MKKTTSGAELLIRLMRTRGESLRAQIERELRQAIQSGRLASGTELPSSRTLADDLGVSRGIIVEAYEQLIAEGYLLAAAGSGTRVAARETTVTAEDASDEPAAPAIAFDFRPGLPDLALFPRRAWLGSMRRVLASTPDAAFDYPDPRGPAAARAALAAYLNRVRATVAHGRRVVFCTGAAQGIGLVCRVLRDRGARRIAVEDPGHADQCTDIQATGLDTPRIPVDAQGLCVDQLERCDADAVMVTPAHQYPTGVVLSAERRAALLAWAARRHATIIEDDYDAEYRYDREPIGALQGLAPERVVYVGSASKVLSPALRLGWLVAPADLLADVSRAKLQTDRGSSALDQLTFADFLARGEMDRHLRRTRPVYRRRRDILLEALHASWPEARVHGVAAGLHVLVEFDEGFDEAAAIDLAQRESIRIYGARDYGTRPEARPALLIGYGGVQEPQIREGMRKLARVLARPATTRRNERT